MLKENLISKGKEIHRGKYDYSLVPDSFTTKEKLTIICPEHGEFLKSYEKHISAGQGCPICSGRQKYTSETFIEKCKTLDNVDDIDFSKVNYVTYGTKVTFICNKKDENGVKHGEFQMNPGHFFGGERCPKCRYIKSAAGRRRSIEEVIQEARKIHGDKYDYSKITSYKNDREKYIIICPLHGEFEQTFNRHIKGKQGCPICGRELCDKKRTMTREQFIDKANKVHGGKYDYSKTEYVKSDIKVCIICPEHGEFWQTPANHLFNQGCPVCKESKLEKEVRIMLANNNIQFIREFSPEWLGKQRLDFYIPKYNIAIECQGKQHFLKEAGWGRNSEGLEVLQERDNRKLELCDQNGIKLLYYSNLNIEYPYEVFTDKQQLLKKIIG